MPNNTPTVRIGIYGPEERLLGGPRGCALWPPGYAAALTAGGATPVSLGKAQAGRSWDHILGDVHGLVFVGNDPTSGRSLTESEHICSWCQDRGMPLLAIDNGMQLLNLAYGGTIHHDLPREVPEALQHRHPPERGLRHAIAVSANTRLAKIYGEGEIIVNSEHSRAIARVGRGFVVSARALDGLIEAIEPESDEWFAIGVQWHPASESASGLDIQLFRGLIEAAQQRIQVTACAA